MRNVIESSRGKEPAATPSRSRAPFQGDQSLKTIHFIFMEIKGKIYCFFNRLIRGDYFKKPTAYWFISCKPTYGSSIQKNKKQKKISSTKGSKKAGICSKERSMISSDYARNFICDFILGKEQKGITEPSLFKEK
jgi:hypothetical protein